jgi:hypothetical protein
MEQEIWRPIPGRNGYEVSDLGRVRSVDRVIPRRWRSGRIVQAKLKGRLLGLHVAAGPGYLYARLGCKSAYVHHLVLEAFVGPRPAGRQAAHGDGDKLNNTLGNLRWATPKENCADKLRHGTALFGAKSPNGRKTHCGRGHPYDDQNTHRIKGKRYCKTCLRDRNRRYRGTPPSRFRGPIEPRQREGERFSTSDFGSV